MAAYRRTLTGRPTLRQLAIAIGLGMLLATAITPVAVGAAPAARAATPAALHADRHNITITGIAGTVLTLQTADGWTRTIDTAGLKITRGGQTIGVADLHVGNRVQLHRAKTTGGASAIDEIRVLLDSVHGVITGLGGGFFTVKIKDGTSRTVTYTGTTTFKLGKTAATSAALAIGLNVGAKGSLAGLVLAATSVQLSLAHAAGVVTALAPGTITVKHGKGNSQPTTIHVTGATTYTKPGGGAAALATVAVGSRVDAAGTWAADGSLNATTVRILKAKGNAGGANCSNGHAKALAKNNCNANDSHARKAAK